MRLFRLKRPVMEFPETAFLSYWPGEIVRHMGRPKGDGSVLAGCVVNAERNFVSIRWEGIEGQELITDPAALAMIVKQPMPAMTQL